MAHRKEGQTASGRNVSQVLHLELQPVLVYTPEPEDVGHWGGSPTGSTALLTFLRPPRTPTSTACSLLLWRTPDHTVPGPRGRAHSPLVSPALGGLWHAALLAQPVAVVSPNPRTLVARGCSG